MQSGHLDIRLKNMVLKSHEDALTRKRMVEHLIDLISKVNDSELQDRIVNQIALIIPEFTTIRF